ncbi:MAG: tetratricopeptide repeat protein, partial [Bacteroidetes bacterium]
TAFAYLNLAGIHYARDQFAEAARMYEQAVMNQPADRLAWIDLGDARFWAGDPEGAATAWHEAERLVDERLAVNAQDLEARALLAALLARLGERARARTLLADLTPRADLSTDALLDLAKAWEILGDRPRALHYLQSALERGHAPAVLAFSAWLDDLRTDPAYARLLRQTLPGS